MGEHNCVKPGTQPSNACVPQCKRTAPARLLMTVHFRVGKPGQVWGSRGMAGDMLHDSTVC